MTLKIRKTFTIILIAFLMFFVSCKKEKYEIKSFHTDKQEEYLCGDYKNYSAYANGTDELSIPLPIVLSAENKNAKKYVLKISENKSLSNSKEYESLLPDFEVYNLKINTAYFYKIICDDVEEEVKAFKIDSKGPRNLYIDGVTNARDIGGWSVGKKKSVKQGLIIRCSKFNVDEGTELVISEKGIDELVNNFKVKTEIDLRRVDNNENGGITSSPLGDEVKYISFPMKSGGNIILLNKDNLKELFNIFGDEANYPIVYHCSIGTDRTGLVAFLINGLLGVSEDDLYRDFLFSNFGQIGSMRTPTIIKTYIETVQTADGKDLSEQIYNYLIGIGVEKEDLDNLKKIML